VIREPEFLPFLVYTLALESMKVDIERNVSELVAFSRALGETLLAKQLTQSDLSMLDQRLKLYREEKLTKLIQDLYVDRKALVEKQQHLGREISSLRKSMEERRKLLV